MATNPSASSLRVDYLFSAVLARTDRWAELNNAARAWAARGGAKQASQHQARCAAAIQELLPLEDYHAYPGPRLLAALQEQVRNGDAIEVSRLVQRIATALMNRSYRHDPAEWDLDEDTAGGAPMPTAGGEVGRPGFDVLFVTPTPASRWPAHAQQVRKLRRNQDSFT